jgi:hypothetical protein
VLVVRLPPLPRLINPLVELELLSPLRIVGGFEGFFAGATVEEGAAVGDVFVLSGEREGDEGEEDEEKKVSVVSTARDRGLEKQSG